MEKENIIIGVIGVLVVIILMLLLNIQNKNNYIHAIKMCGNEENIIEHFTEEGDIYYTCKIEKK